MPERDLAIVEYSPITGLTLDQFVLRALLEGTMNRENAVRLLGPTFENVFGTETHERLEDRAYPLPLVTDGVIAPMLRQVVDPCRGDFFPGEQVRHLAPYPNTKWQETNIWAIEDGLVVIQTPPWALLYYNPRYPGLLSVHDYTTLRGEQRTQGVRSETSTILLLSCYEKVSDRASGPKAFRKPTEPVRRQSEIIRSTMRQFGLGMPKPVLLNENVHYLDTYRRDVARSTPGANRTRKPRPTRLPTRPRQ